MKNFLKSTAIFACVALLFGACSKDSTEDEAGGNSVVATPSITEATPGDGKIYLAWDVPSICDADESVITWYDVSDTTTPIGSYTEEVVAGGSYSCTIGETDALVAGTYSVTVANRISTTGDTSKIATTEVKVYSAESYATKLPVPANYYYEVITSTTGTVHITWGAFHADCQSVTVYYGTDYGTPKSVSELVEGAETLLQGVSPGQTNFKYVATFAPSADSDVVTVESEVLELGITASAPANVVAKSGLGRFELCWDLAADEFDYITSVEITYADDKTLSVEKADLVSGTNSIYIPMDATGYYSASLYTITSGGFISETATTESDAWVYAEDSFTLPMVTEVVNNKGVVTVYWATAEHATGWKAYVKNSDDSVSDTVAMTYEDVTDDDGVTTRTYTTTFENPELGGIIYISEATYLPEGAIESDVIIFEDEDSGYTVPASEQSIPVITSVSTSDDAKVTITWDILDAYDLTATVINFYADGVDTPVSVSVDAVAESDNSATLTTEDGIVVGTTYSIKVQTTSKLGDLSTESEAVEGVLIYNSETFTASNYPTPTASFADGQVSIEWANIGYVQSLTVLYSGTEYPFVLNETKDALVLSDGATSFTYQEGVTTFTFENVVFLPTYGTGTVTVATVSDAMTIAAPVPVAPTLTALTTGYETVAGDTPSYTSYMVVEWSIDASEAIADADAKTTIYYKASADTDYTSIDVATVADQTEYTSDKIAVTASETYSVYVVTTNQYAIASVASDSKSVTTYNGTSYSVAPTVATVFLSSSATSGYDALVTWDDFAGADLQSVVFSYGDGQTASATVTDGVLESTTTLSSITVGGTYSYTATFCPANGIEGVDVVVSDQQFPSVAIPVLATVAPGYEDDASTITVAWTLSSDVGVSAIRAYYFEGENVAFDSVAATYVTADKTATSVTIPGVDADKVYTVYVAATNDSGEVFEDSVNVGSATTYGASTYSNATITPTITTADDLVSVASWVTSTDVAATDDYYVAYTSGSVTGTITDFASATTFAYLYGSTTSFAYDLYIKPATGNGYVKIAQAAVAVPEQTPDAPTALAATYGIDDDGKSYINLTWTAGGVDDVAKYVVYYTIGEGAEQSVDVTDTAAVSYKFEDIQSSDFGSYSITVTTQTAAGTESAKTAQTTATAYGAATYAEATLPTLTASAADDVVTMVWNTEGVSDLYSVTYTYGETTATILAADLANTTVAYVYGTESISYDVAFQPTGGSGTVSRTADAVTFAEQAPSAPTTVAVSEYGYNETDGAYATITWVEPTSTATIAKAVVYAADADGNKTDAVEVDAATLTYKFAGLTAGKTYTFYVATKSAAGTASADVASTTTATAYDATSYTAENLPTATVVYDFDTTNATITWSDINADLQMLTLTYGTTDYLVDITAETVTSTFAYDATAGVTFTYSAEFAPVGGMGNVAVTGAGEFSVDAFYDISLVDGTYQISSGLGLAVFADLVNGSHIYKDTEGLLINGFSYPESTQDYSYTGINGKLMEDVDISAYGGTAITTSWRPIGANYDVTAYVNDGTTTAMTTYPYTGTFDGNNKSVTGLSACGSNSNTGLGSRLGLFGYVKDATISNITFVDPYVQHRAGMSGAVAGYAETSTISNCTVTMTTTTSVTPDDYASVVGTTFASTTTYNAGGTGAIVGRMISSTVENCTNYGNARSYSTSTSYGNTGQVGGIVGYVEGTSSAKSYIKNCKNYGAMLAANGGSVGGIAGYAIYVEISDCTSTNNIITLNSNAGGIVGYAYNTVTITNCSSSSDVYGLSDLVTTGAHIGGIVGQTTSACSVSTSYSTGNVSAVGYGNGGIVGTNAGTITSCGYSVGIITATNEAGNEFVYTGGVAGSNSGTVSSSTNSGAVVTSGTYTGGIIGNNTGTVSGCTFSGSVTSATVSDYIGSICGNDGDTTTSGNTNSGSVVTPGTVSDAEAVTVTSASLNADNEGITVAWSYSAGNANIAAVNVYYKVSSADEYILIACDNTITTASFDAVLGNTYQIYVVTTNVLGSETAAINGGTATSPLEVENAMDASTTDIYLNESGVYEIRTTAGLVAFQELVNGTAATTTPDVVSNVASWTKDVSADAVLINDLDLSSVCSESLATNWTPIGASGSVYTGTFDGDGKVISNLYISDSGTTYRALFSYINGATIKNLTLDKPIVSGAGNTSAMISNAVGTAIIDNCHLTGAGVITGAGTNSGGIVGYASPALIMNCSTAAEMSLSGTGSASGSAGIAGITGHIAGTVINCHNAASVVGSRNVGGITGYTGAVTFIGCSNSGYVYSGKSAGGIVGKSNGQLYVIGCYNTGESKTTSTTASEVAGIIGCSNSNMTLYGCYSTGIGNNGLTGYKNTTSTYAYVGCYYDSSLVTAAGGGTYNNADSTFEGGMAGVSSVLDYISTSYTTTYEVEVDEVTTTVEYTTVSMNDAIATALVDNDYVTSCVINADGTATITMK